MNHRGLLMAGIVALAGSATVIDAVWTPKEWGATEKANVKIVQGFWTGLEAGDADAHLAAVAADATLRNQAHTPSAAVTPEARRATVTNYLKPGAIKVKTLNVIAQGPIVVDTRIDRLIAANGVRDMHYMGVYLLKDGKIKEWMDYEIAPDRSVKAGDPFAEPAGMGWTVAEKANVKAVNDFLRAWEEKKDDVIVSLLAADSKSRTAAHGPQRPMSPDALRKTASQFFATSSAQFKTLETFAQGPMVINTRVDRITMKNGQQDLYYLGVFFLQDGKIKEWSDYEVAKPTPVKKGQPL